MPEILTIGEVLQLQDLINPARFKEIVLAGISAVEGILNEGDRALEKELFDQAEELWKRAFDGFRLVAASVIQRRLKVGKNEGSEIRVRFQTLWKRLMIFGLKKKVATAVAVNAQA